MEPDRSNDKIISWQTCANLEGR